MNLKHLIEHKQEVYFVNVLKKKRSYTSSEDLFVAFIQSNSGSGSSRGSALKVKLELRTSKPGLRCFAENAEVLCSSSWCSDSASLQDSADVFLLRTVCVCSEEPACMMYQKDKHSQLDKKQRCCRSLEGGGGGQEVNKAENHKQQVTRRSSKKQSVH